jgi:hypothetical protein
MHCDINALFFGHNELLTILKVMHVPKLYLPIGRSGGYLVVLVERVQLILGLFDIKLRW